MLIVNTKMNIYKYIYIYINIHSNIIYNKNRKYKNNTKNKLKETAPGADLHKYLRKCLPGASRGASGERLGNPSRPPEAPRAPQDGPKSRQERPKSRPGAISERPWRDQPCSQEPPGGLQDPSERAI